MIARIVLGAALLTLAVVALRHPAPAPAPPAVTSLEPPSPAPHAEVPRRRARGAAPTGDASLVYVAGAVVHPGLYRLQPGARAADAVALAGGLTGSADAAGINLAARIADGDEVYAPPAGQAPPRRSGPAASRHRSGRRRSATPFAAAGVDVNTASAAELEAVPGIGRAVAARIVEMRESAGAFASFDELLDVAGMTQTRLERARPYLRSP